MLRKLFPSTKIIKSILAYLIMTGALLGSASAAAQNAQEASTQKYNAVASQQNVGDLIRILGALEQKPIISKADAILLVRNMFLENSRGITAEHKRLMTALSTAHSDSNVVVYAEETYTLPHAAPEAIHYMNYFNTDFNLNDIWLKDAAKMTDMIDIYVTAPATEKRLKKFVSSKVYNEWQQSSIHNGFTPLRDLIADYYTLAEPLPEPQNTEARRLLYDATKAVDIYVKDKIPDFTYVWLCVLLTSSETNPDTDCRASR